MIPTQKARIIIGFCVVLGVIVACMPILLHMLYGSHRARPLAGEVVAVATSTITIKDRQGKQFTLVVASTTKSFLPIDQELTPGTMIQAFGVRDDTGQFILTDIRPFKVPKL